MKIAKRILPATKRARIQFDRIAKKLNIERQEDWYGLSSSSLAKLGHAPLLARYGYNLCAALRHAYPEYHWAPWFFRSGPSKFWKSLSNQKVYLDWLAEHLLISVASDWYSVSAKKVRAAYGKRLLQAHGSLAHLLQRVYPQFEWNEWQFTDLPATYWHSIQNQRAYMDWLASELGIHEQGEWYGVSAETLTLLPHASPSMFYLLESTYPEFEWQAWKLVDGAPPHYWEDAAHRRKYILWFESQFNIQSPEQWYKITHDNLKENFGAGILTHYNHSMLKLVQEAYPDFHWLPWRFEFSHFLRKPSNQRIYFDWIAEKLGIEEQSEWYNVSPHVLEHHGARLLLQQYHHNLAQVLQSVYPEYDWYPWLFLRAPTNYWISLENQRKFCDWLAVQLGIETPEDWYGVTVDVIRSVAGDAFLHYYKGSVYSVLREVYPEVDWRPWEFTRTKKYFWEHLKNQRAYFDWLGNQLQITHPAKWYSVTVQKVRTYGGAGLLKYYQGSVTKALEAVYPEYEWKKIPAMSLGQDSVQIFLKSLVKGNVLLNFRHPQLISADSSRKLELDVYIPSLQLAFEYQGNQHYSGPHNFFSGSSVQGIKDAQKKQLCQQIGITLIEVPYWWKASAASLFSTLRQHRPELPPAALKSVMHNLKAAMDFK